MLFEIFRAGPVSGTDTVAYSTAGFAGSGFDAASVSDFKPAQFQPPAFPSGAVTFSGTEMVKTSSPNISKDIQQEADEGILAGESLERHAFPLSTVSR